MKPVILIAIAFVLLIPITVYAQNNFILNDELMQRTITENFKSSLDGIDVSLELKLYFEL